VSSELLKFIHNPLSPNSASADSPYFHPHSLWSDCSGASWVSSIWKRVLLSRSRTECLCFQLQSFLADAAVTRTRRFALKLSSGNLILFLPQVVIPQWLVHFAGYPQAVKQDP
jgi:hypothetical protein